MPELISSRFFEIFDFDKDGYLNKEEFVEAFITVFASPLDKRLAMTFSLYDFNNDGIVYPSDINMFLSYINFETFK
jgi:Ca2+-binding EF-hand superfamily protein